MREMRLKSTKTCLEGFSQNSRAGLYPAPWLSSPCPFCSVSMSENNYSRTAEITQCVISTMFPKGGSRHAR